MLRDLSIAVSPMLALLLVMLTPIGTGQGAHRDQLLDPIFPHVHFAGGLTAAQGAALRAAQRVFGDDRQRPELGAGVGASSNTVSVGLTPPMARWSMMIPSGTSSRSIAPLGALLHGAFADAPPDPPPTGR